MNLNNTKFLVGFFLLLIAAGTFFTIKYGLVPRPIPKIKLSSFEGPSEVSRSINQAISIEIKNAPIWFLGFDPENKIQEQLVRQFIKDNPMDLLIVDSNIRLEFESSSGLEKIDLKDQFTKLVDALLQSLKNGRKVIIIGPAIYSAPGVKGNILYRLKELAARPSQELSIGSLTFVEMVRNRADEKNVNIKCLTPETDVTGTGSLGCAILQESRMYYRKKLVPGKHAGSMDQRGAMDYMFFYANDPEIKI